MQSNTTIAPTSELDRLRPRVLEALRVRGWTCEPSQIGDRFRVRCRKQFGVDPRTGAPRHTVAVLTFTEDGTGDSVTGHGAHDALADLRAEGVLS